MRRNWKVILSAAAVSCMVLSLAACGGGNEDLVSDAGKDTSDENVKLVFLRAGTEDYKKDAFTQMIDSLASIGARVPMGQYECLDSYAEGWEGMEDMYDSVKEAGSIGGKLYGVPYTPDARMFAINTELFEKAGLDPDSPPSNWDELLEAHKKLMVKDYSGNVFPPAEEISTNIWKYSLFRTA